MRQIMKGNEVIAEAALQAGCKFYGGYPITPQNEIPEYMSKRAPTFNAVFIQAEAEISAINMLFGAAAAGFRCMTSSSSPGISLKQEGISYIAGGELPCVIVNIVRGGPGLGNIRASQADYFQSVKGGGHGDYHMIVIAPSTLQEAYDLTMNAFDYADYYRNPVMILGDGLLGQMFEPVEIKEYKPILELPKKDFILDGCKGRQGLLRHYIYVLYWI
jgi:2-oxoglutarate ferredoxin oxidoreductase subunit alpha